MKLILPLFALLAISLSTNAQKPTPTPSPAPYLMAVDDVFYITGRGVVATGKVERGSVKVGDAIEIVGIKPTRSTTVAGIEMFRKVVSEAKAGETVGIMLRGIEKSDVERGQVLSKPGSIKASAKFKAKIDVIAAADGGRRTPFATGFRPQVMIRTGSFSGVVTLPAGKTNAAPGEIGIEIEIELTQMAALEKGLAISENPVGPSPPEL